MDITRNEYWFLDVVVEETLCLSALIDESFEQAYNRNGHGLKYNEIIHTLDRLFQRGNLTACYYPSTNLPSISTEDFVPTIEEIKAGVQEVLPSSLWYKLTQQGAERWELISRPNWNLYISPLCSQHEEENQGCIEAGSRQILEEFLMFELANPFRTVDLSSIEWEELEPWEATYWKTLPIGYQLSYFAEDIPYNSQEDTIKANAFDAIYFKWKRQNLWYTNYFEAN
jgi:hypothetical protein